MVMVVVVGSHGFRRLHSHRVGSGKWLSYLVPVAVVGVVFRVCVMFGSIVIDFFPFLDVTMFSSYQYDWLQ